ncbi:MAG: response regulator [Myxococcaceae bacterium]
MTMGARVRVFVVEDQAALLRQLLKALAGFEALEIVGSAQEGERALKGIGETLPDVVLMDLELPGMTGLEITQRVKLRHPNVDVLVLTSFDDEQKVYEAMQQGASGYLVKRVGPQRICDAVLEVHQGGVVIEAQIAKRFWNYFQSVQGRARADENNPWGLTELELDVLCFLAKGLSNVEVGRALSLERRTVRTHLSHIYKKMGVRSHVDAVVRALQSGWIDL